MRGVPTLLYEAWDKQFLEFLLEAESPLDCNVISEFNVIFRGHICNEFRFVYFLESLTNTEVDISGFMHTYIVLILWNPHIYCLYLMEIHTSQRWRPVKNIELRRKGCLLNCLPTVLIHVFRSE